MTRLPTVYHVASLAGGPQRVAEAVIAALVEREQVRPATNGRLYLTPLFPADPLGQEAVRLLAGRDGLTAAELRSELARAPAVRAVEDDLVARGLVVRQPRFKLLRPLVRPGRPTKAGRRVLREVQNDLSLLGGAAGEVAWRGAGWEIL